MIVPSASVEDAPFSVTVFVGRVITWSAPAFATGGTLGNATVTFTVSRDADPRLSVTVSSNE